MPYRVSQMVALLCLDGFILTGGKTSGHTSVEFTSLSDLVFFKKKEGEGGEAILPVIPLSLFNCKILFYGVTDLALAEFISEMC